MKEIKVLDKGFVRLVETMPVEDGDQAIIDAARVSYGAGTKSVSDDRGLIRFLMRNSHLTPFEMCELKFHMKLPIFVARQIIRHRTANVNEISQRYSKIMEEFYVPDHSRICAQSKNNKQASGQALSKEAADNIISQMIQGQEIAYVDYCEFIDHGLAREVARINLPLSTYTEWYWKIDLRNLFHFIRLRAHPHAQREAQLYAEAIYELIKPFAPLACEAFEDYVMNAKNFSADEMKVMYKFIETFREEHSEEFVSIMADLKEKFGKSEFVEFKNKLEI